MSLVNPLAALLPLMDIGNGADADRGGLACGSLAARIKAKPLLPPAEPAPPTRGLVRAADGPTR